MAPETGQPCLIKNFEKACELNVAPAFGALGSLYFNGNGVKQSYKKAAEYTGKGCQLDDGRSCSLLGLSYYHGLGVKKSNRKALTFF